MLGQEREVRAARDLVTAAALQACCGDKVPRGSYLSLLP